ncbi:UNKNOWN [Stylonychia lemnae]|uniref:Uncharacterized protein n=1 Tax=Stylonychia lemnae TaxID=5949 RepID=A0A077ZRA6_STYLE|nr:UNKNOWN [Stylonychia lemnae]|eukprot:CDW72453.1 UNKNOWN [Stylonychia lemnae]
MLHRMNYKLRIQLRMTRTSGHSLKISSFDPLHTFKSCNRKYRLDLKALFIIDKSLKVTEITKLMFMNQIKWNKLNEPVIWKQKSGRPAVNLKTILQDINLPKIDIKIKGVYQNEQSDYNSVSNIQKYSSIKIQTLQRRQTRNLSQNLIKLPKSINTVVANPTEERVNEIFSKAFVENQNVIARQKTIFQKMKSPEKIKENISPRRSNLDNNQMNYNSLIDGRRMAILEEASPKDNESDQSFYKSNEDEDDESVHSMPKIMAKNNFMEQIEREISMIMKEENFLNEKSQAISAGGPIDKQELKLTNFDIAAAFTQISNDSLKKQKTKSNALNIQNDSSLIDEDFHQNSQNMRQNNFFQKFMTKHERSIERAIERLDEQTNTKINANVKAQLMNFLQQNNIYRKANRELFKELKIKGQTSVMENFSQGGIVRKQDPKDIEKIRKQNMRPIEELQYHERFQDKMRIISSREINRLKEQNYGKWYINPNDFNKKIVKLNKKFQNLNKALGID